VLRKQIQKFIIRPPQPVRMRVASSIPPPPLRQSCNMRMAEVQGGLLANYGPDQGSPVLSLNIQLSSSERRPFAPHCLDGSRSARLSRERSDPSGRLELQRQRDQPRNRENVVT
jgi:hypothetical protein